MGQSFPTATPSYNDTQGGETLGSAGAGNGLSRILDDYGLDLTATTQKIGTGASTPTINKVLAGSGVGTSVWSSTLAGLTLTSPVINTPTGIVKGDVGLGNVDNTSNATERAATATLTNKDLSSATNIFPDYYPVGTQYVNLTNSANPSTYLPGQSASTWTADSGTVTVAKAASGTFATAGATGGAETHTLTEAEMPAHSHGIRQYGGGGAGTGYRLPADIRTSWGGSVLTVSTCDNTGGGGSHNNLQPYKVKYVWNRVS